MQMPDAHEVLFRTLADPTRRALFERLCREGEQTVGADQPLPPPRRVDTHEFRGRVHRGASRFGAVAGRVAGAVACAQ